MSDLPTPDALKEIVGRFWKPDRVLHDDPIGELERKLATAIQERDEARRLHCVEITRESMNPKRFTPEWAAKQLGWDCFAQEGGGA